MLETKEQKRYFVTIIVLILILGLISFWTRPKNYQYTDTTDYNALQKKQQAMAEAYQKYLDSLQVDPVASKELFQQLLTQADIEKEVKAELQVDQQIVPPVVADKDIKTTSKTDQQTLSDYLTNTIGPIASFNSKAKVSSKALFTQDKTAVGQLLTEYQNTYNKIASATVPKEAVPMQKALLVSYAAYGRLLNTAQAYAGQVGNKPWPDVYQNYVVINDNYETVNTEFNKLSAKYKLAELPPLIYHDNEYAVKDGQKFELVKTAHAIFGLGDLSITVGDIPRIIMDAIQEGLVTSFSQFMGSFIQNMVVKIESNYMIANFLYYSDALVSSQYTSDYLNKYVSNAFDRTMVKNFIPQLTCGQQNANLRPVFQAKASQFLGFSPTALDPKDPQYYQKLSMVGNFMASPSGWEIYYKDLAAQAQSEAQKAADKELTSSGLKTPHDLVNNNITLSVNSIISAEQANLNAIMNLGINNAERFIGGLVSSLVQNLMNNFVFRGAVAQGSQPSVLKEQSTCLAAAQVNLVLPTANTNYQQPNTSVDENQVLQQQCAKYPEACPPKTNTR